MTAAGPDGDPSRARAERTDDLSLVGRTALVTGSGRNIGRATVLELARHGADVVVNTRSNRAEAEAVAAEAEALGVRAAVFVGDITDPETVRSLAAEARAAFGRVDIYVSNAARRLSKGFHETTDEDWHRHLNMQLTTSWYLAKAFVPGMEEAGWGRIIHIGGPDGWYGGHRRFPHAAAKGGLRTLTKGLATELGSKGITVNDVVPGFVETARDPVTHPHINPEYTASKIKDIPIGRQVSTDEVAWACAWLCSRRSGGITGAAIHVDGGERMLG